MKIVIFQVARQILATDITATIICPASHKLDSLIAAYGFTESGDWISQA